MSRGDFSYDVLGNLKTKTGFNGKVTTYNYDSLNRLTSIVPDASLSEPTISFTYKPNGQRATLSDAKQGEIVLEVVGIGP